MGEYNTIADTALDTDSPFTTTVAAALAENANYGIDHAIRCGTDAVGVRLAVARLYEDFGNASAGTNDYFEGTFTFSTDALDGNPNFSDTPTPIVALKQRTFGGSYDSWEKANNIFEWEAVITDLTSTTCGYTVQFINTAGADLLGTINVILIGPVTSGE